MNCKQCTEELINKREDALFCNANCKQKYFKRKKQILNKIERLEKSIRMEEDAQKYFNEQLLDIHENIKTNLGYLKSNLVELEKSLSEVARTVRLNNRGFYSEFMEAIEDDPDKYWREIQIMKGFDSSRKQKLLQKYRNQFREVEKQKRKEYEEKFIEYTQAAQHVKSGRPIDAQKELLVKVEKSKREVVQFKEELEGLRSIDLDRLPPKPNPKRKNRPSKRTSPVRAFSGREILTMEFNGIQLAGEIGRFLGKLEREKCAIALTGNSGAGKSTFSYQLAKAFLEARQSVAYFSLESGFTESMQKLVAKYGIGKYKFDAFGEGTLTDVRTEANNYDCVIVDSYAKISSKAQDFEDLRQDFPNTFFIIIFQKTTDGKIRGGSSILYNSTATIDIGISDQEHRMAWMKKSRYGTENFVYSINQDKLLKDDKIPTKWTKINETWQSPSRKY
jgi:hypothetical protein